MNYCIIITTYNCLEYTKTCYKTCCCQKPTPGLIIIADNASTDGTQEWAVKQKVLYVRNEENMGLSHLWNRAIEEAIKQEYDHIFVVNNDIVMRPDCISHLMEIKRNKNVDVICANNRDNGFALFYISPDVYRKVGRFDENIFLFHEDTDYKHRIMLNDLDYCVLRTPHFYHYHRVSSQKANIDIDKKSQEMLQYLEKKWGLELFVDEGTFDPAYRIYFEPVNVVKIGEENTKIYNMINKYHIGYDLYKPIEGSVLVTHFKNAYPTLVIKGGPFWVPNSWFLFILTAISQYFDNIGILYPIVEKETEDVLVRREFVKCNFQPQSPCYLISQQMMTKITKYKNLDLDEAISEVQQQFNHYRAGCKIKLGVEPKNAFEKKNEEN